MEALLSADFGEKSFNDDLEASVEEIKEEFKKACVAFIAVGKGLTQLKDDFGKQFYELIDEIK
ncbi:MAG TPA: hypothetical protein DCL61_21900 [Cyanobacteria bacterium UBA12227]|nr:hypothetical protein [Cyanobacteria bacterium UBA12227]